MLGQRVDAVPAMNEVYAPFRRRVITPLSPRLEGGYSIKRYGVALPSVPFDEPRFARAEQALAALLPPVDIARGRPGAAFLILHQGAAVDYAVLAWWDRENELPTRVWIRRDGAWAPAADDESFCVWDLELLWFERNAWIETVLSGAALEEGLAEYRGRVFSAPPR